MGVDAPAGLQHRHCGKTITVAHTGDGAENVIHLALAASDLAHPASSASRRRGPWAARREVLGYAPAGRHGTAQLDSSRMMPMIEHGSSIRSPQHAPDHLQQL